ncbi:restriction endonuclease subunit S, partial [Crocosphaera chwakensis]
ENIKFIIRSKKEDSIIINEIFGKEFNISLSDISSIDTNSKIHINLSDIYFGNNNIRNSFRWNKIQLIQKFIYKNIDCIQLLGNFIIKTKNGWSPPSIEGGNGIPILGQEHFGSDGVLKILPTKFTEDTKNNIENYFIQEGDFFVSRGNTIDLVALASVVEEEISEDILFPDLYIKVKLDETVIDKKYLALLFNSFFGRLYFKYVSKGKNQTMVKISSRELYNFYLPIPDIKKQKKIVEGITDKIDEQSKINKKIEKNIAKINLIIEESINQNQ